MNFFSAARVCSFSLPRYSRRGLGRWRELRPVSQSPLPNPPPGFRSREKRRKPRAIKTAFVSLIAIVCTSCVHVKTEPIVIKHEVTIGVDKALEDYFAYEERSGTATEPTTMTTTAETATTAVAVTATAPTTAAATQSRRERFHQRAPQLAQLKAAGIIGETADGFIDFVQQPLTALDPLVQAENNDRKGVYEYLAQQRKTTPDAIAARNAQRLYDKAPAGTFFRGADGKWTKKS